MPVTAITEITFERVDIGSSAIRALPLHYTCTVFRRRSAAGHSYHWQSHCNLNRFSSVQHDFTIQFLPYATRGTDVAGIPNKTEHLEISALAAWLHTGTGARGRCNAASCCGLRENTITKAGAPTQHEASHTQTCQCSLRAASRHHHLTVTMRHADRQQAALLMHWKASVVAYPSTLTPHS